MYRLCIAHDGPKTADPTLAPLRSAFVPTFREDSQQCAVAGHNSRPSPGSLVFAAACGSRRPTLPNCLVGIVPHFGPHRLQMTFEEGAAVPPNTAAIRVRIQDLKAKHLQIF